MISHRSLSLLLALALPLTVGAIAACSEEGLSGVNGLGGPAPGASASPSATGTAPQATPTPTTMPTQTPTATPTPFATLVSITPASVKLWLPAGPTEGHGAALDYPSEATLKAVVTFSDGSTSSAVTWTSLAPSWVTVSEAGVVSAIATDALTVAAPTGVRVRATSLDGKASLDRSIDIATDGGVAVVVQ